VSNSAEDHALRLECNTYFSLPSRLSVSVFTSLLSCSPSPHGCSNSAFGSTASFTLPELIRWTISALTRVLLVVATRGRMATSALGATGWCTESHSSPADALCSRRRLCPAAIRTSGTSGPAAGGALCTPFAGPRLVTVYPPPTHRLRSLISRPHDYSPTSRHVPQPCIFISSYDLCSSSAIRIIASTVYARGARSSHHIAFWITSRHVVLARLARAAVAETAHWKRQKDYHIRP
jgi:hypothetical protein